MGKITKRVVNAAEERANDYVIWDDELPGFGLRVFVSGKRSYVIQYRTAGRSRRYTIGLHGIWTPETARQEAKILLGRIAKGDYPAEERQLDLKAITMKELCALYLGDMEAGLILGKGGRPKKATTVSTDKCVSPATSSADQHAQSQGRHKSGCKPRAQGRDRRQDGRCRQNPELRGKAIVRGGVGTATRTIGLLGGILTYAIDAGIIETNPAHGVRKPKDNVRVRHLTESEYRLLGQIFTDAR